jgi:hypothetical protein
MSDFPLSNKVTKTKFALLETRFEGEGGVPSSFTPPRSEITFSPSPGDLSRLTNVHSNMTFDGSRNHEGEASQSSCKTLKCGNVAPVAAVAVSDILCSCKYQSIIHDKLMAHLYATTGFTGQCQSYPERECR